RKSRSVADGEGHIKDLGECAGQESLAAAGRTDEENVALIYFHIAVSLVAQTQTFVMIVNGDRQHLFGPLLADDILVELILDGAGRRDVCKDRFGSAAAAFFLIDD